MMAFKKKDPEPFLPLTSAMFHVLLALADGEKHGYAILKEVAQRTGGRVRLSAGTLYGIIHRLLGEGLIVESDERPDPALDDERRRYYRLADFGRRVAVAEAERMEEMLDVARAKKLIKRPAPAQS
jgi:DNA-binding PadR family transcriptional regulator